MAADHELPVWAVRPNWSSPVIETLSWKTSVLSSQSSAEQRLSWRPTPRRLVEATYNPLNHERTFVDLAMHRLARHEWMMPLWFDGSLLTDSVSSGASRIELATDFHEFTVGGMAVLIGSDTFTSESVRIAAIDDTGIDLVEPLLNDWREGTIVHPMRRGRFEPPNLQNLTGSVGDMTLRFESITGNALADEGSWETLVGEVPLITTGPNWAESVDIELSVPGERFDSDIGQISITNWGGRSFRTQPLSFFLVGQEEQFAFRQMLYRLRGQQTSVWLPTFTDDLEIAATANSGATSIDIKECGFAYSGGPFSGRERIILPNNQIVQVTAAERLVGGGKERLTLGSALTAGLAIGDLAQFIDKARLANDTVEIEHMTNSSGLARAVLPFSNFDDRRSATTAVQPIPAAAYLSGACGSPDESGDSACAPDAPVYSGYAWEWHFVINRMGDDYPISGTPLIQRWTGSGWTQVTSGNTGKVELGGGIFSYTIEVSPFGHVPSFGNGQQYRAGFDPGQTLPPEGQSNDRFMQVYGRPWYANRVLMVAEFMSGGHISHTDPFTI